MAEEMQIGVMFPQNEIGSDVANIRAFALAAAESGCRHIWATDHVIGADTSTRPDWKGTYGLDHEFHEPLLLFAYLAAICDEMEFVSGIIILPQRQTVLVAKQAATLDILCRGRLRLGVGVGWNPVEYDALGADFKTRGKRIDEQILLLRRLWTERSVSFEGRFDRIEAAGIAPLPLQQPIPLWLGAANNEGALRRVGRLGDGYLSHGAAEEDGRMEHHVAFIREAAREAGRDPASIGLQGLLPVVGKSKDQVLTIARRWQALGATHLTIDPRSVSLHVNRDLSMAEKVTLRRSATQQLIEEIGRATDYLRDL